MNAKIFDDCGGELWKVKVVDAELNANEVVYTISINIVNKKAKENYTRYVVFSSDYDIDEFHKGKEFAMRALMREIRRLHSGEGIIWLCGLEQK